MSTTLLLEFGVGGGMPPITSELLRIYQDGTATYLKSMQSEGQAQDKFDFYQFYQMQLSTLDLQSIKDFLSTYHYFFDMNEKYTPIRSDSGFNILSLYIADRTKKMEWGHFAKIPEPLNELRTRLDAILAHICQQNGVNDNSGDSHSS